MSRSRTLSRKKKIALMAGALVLAGGTAVVLAGTSQASVACDGLATALANNERFIADQRADPDALSQARIANREAVIAEIRRKQAASGCEGEAGADVEAGDGADTDAETGAVAGGEAGGVTVTPSPSAPPAAPPEQAAPPAAEQGAEQGADVVCAGSTVTLSGEAGAPAASSNQFPLGTLLKVTNLDNAKSTTVEVTSVSGSCALLNNAAFEEVREPGKFLIRKARIERVG
ncbi:hypothetical protein [Streptomyces lateritius]|uniref:hypothetical protein n=1 Tax=Streptomyces lateritius TaxID=67313 RepID=UPI0016777FEA|nr:hypothetical protein [Streptomyces lateritius]